MYRMLIEVYGINVLDGGIEIYQQDYVCEMCIMYVCNVLYTGTSQVMRGK